MDNKVLLIIAIVGFHATAAQLYGIKILLLNKKNQVIELGRKTKYTLFAE